MKKNLLFTHMHKWKIYTGNIFRDYYFSVHSAAQKQMWILITIIIILSFHSWPKLLFTLMGEGVKNVLTFSLALKKSFVINSKHFLSLQMQIHII